MDVAQDEGSKTFELQIHKTEINIFSYEQYKKLLLTNIVINIWYYQSSIFCQSNGNKVVLKLYIYEYQRK